MISEDDGVLIFKDRNIYKIYTTGGSSSWLMRKVVPNIGCTVPYSICTIAPRTHFFVSNGIFYIYSNGQVKRIGDKIYPIISSNYDLTTLETVYDRERNWVWATVDKTGGSNKGRYILILDLNKDVETWYFWTTTSKAERCPFITKGNVVLFGNGTTLNTYGTGYSDNAAGTAQDINLSMTTKTFDVDNGTVKRIFAKIKKGSDVDTLAMTMTNEAGSTLSYSGSTPASGSSYIRVNQPGDLKVREGYMTLTLASADAFEISEMGFDWIPEREQGGVV